MLAHLRQYKHEEVQFDDNRTTGESQTEDAVDKEPEEYFGKNIDEFDLETWETVEHEDDPIQRREVTLDGVTAVSVPKEPTDEDDPDLPGQTLQLRMGGGIEFLANAEIVEVQDQNPQSEAEGKVSKEDDPQGKASMDDEP
ncbi:hypothetical protein [Natronobacterium texcoconense]|uniref:Uncharacterized protein n=1 Tax=Natronobacterium texcoconense TaxID=1095778 RepID=A0A1H0ZSC9_NATTX|nr:hypothetical protein [Natronobacterium texcoconense]SDQ30313.1 hypothetical protein SAMN04489842_0413 [Natronobacterium texcoconense]